jgi:hypothetical protein
VAPRRPTRRRTRLALRLAIGLGAFGAVSLAPLLTLDRSPGQTLAATARGAGSPAAAAMVAAQDPRVDEAMRGLATDADRVGQLLLLGWVGTTAEEARPTLRDLRPGGIVYVDNARTETAATAINAGLLDISREIGLLAPLIAVDHEGGRVQRIVDVANLGSNRDFAAGQPSDAQACERGLTHAR